MDTCEKIVLQPENLSVNLYKHQLSSIYNLEHLENNEIVLRDNNKSIKTSIGVFADPVGSGKCHGKNTEILMYDCSLKKVQDIKVGDLLMGDDSKSRKVLSITSGSEKMYKIHQEYGCDYTVNESHILSLQVFKSKQLIETQDHFIIKFFCKSKLNFDQVKYSKNNIDYDSLKTIIKNVYDKINVDNKIDICLRDYLKLDDEFKQNLVGYKSQLEFKQKPTQFDPYFKGIYLVYDFTQQDILLKNIHFKSVFFCQPNQLDESINNYIFNSSKVRLLFLSGIIDCIGKQNQTYYEICLYDEAIINIVVFLCRSLGIYVTIISSYEIKIHNSKFASNLYLNFLKKLDYYTDIDYSLSKITIEPLNYDTYYGFTIGNNHRYLLKDLTVTHNTFSMLGLLSRDKMKWDTTQNFTKKHYILESANLIKKIHKVSYYRLKTNLILVSNSIIAQWINELSKTSLSFSTITNNKELKSIIPENYDCILVNTSMYNKVIECYEGYAWKRFIYDEPGHIKVPSMKDVVAGFTWLISSTPEHIIYNHKNCKKSFMKKIIGELWCDFENHFKYVIIKNSKDFIEKSYQLPGVIYEKYYCKNNVLTTLKGSIDKNLYNMIEADNIQDVMNQLGCKTTDNIIKVITQQKTQQIMNLDMDIEYFIKKNNKKKVEKYKEKKQNIIKQLGNIKLKLQQNKSICNICMDTIHKPILETNCNNFFCGKCILLWLEQKDSCPLCRSTINKENLIMYESNLETSTLIQESQTKTKLETIVSIILSREKGSFIIFSQYKNTLENINKVLDRNNISYTTIKGTYKQRQKQIDDYNNGIVSTMLLNSSTDGAGINLQKTTDIILYNQLSEDTKIQIIGRANRIGRKQQLYIHQLYIKFKEQ